MTLLLLPNFDHRKVWPLFLIVTDHFLSLLILVLLLVCIVLAAAIVRRIWFLGTLFSIRHVCALLDRWWRNHILIDELRIPHILVILWLTCYFHSLLLPWATRRLFLHLARADLTASLLLFGYSGRCICLAIFASSVYCGSWYITDAKLIERFLVVGRGKWMLYCPSYWLIYYFVPCRSMVSGRARPANLAHFIPLPQDEHFLDVLLHVILLIIFVLAVLINGSLLDLYRNVLMLELAWERLLGAHRHWLCLDNDCCVGTPTLLVDLLRLLSVTPDRLRKPLLLHPLCLSVGLLFLIKVLYRVVVRI